MSDEHDQGTGPRWRGRSEEEAVARLVAEAGPRPELPRADLAAIRLAARATWAAHYRRRWRVIPPPAWRLLAAAAAALAVGSVAWWVLRPSAGEPPVVATVVRGGSAAMQRVGDGPPRTLADGASVVAGSTVVTGAADGVTLALAAGGSLRLAAASTVELAAADRLLLRAGALYVDDGGAGGSGLAVDTAVGTFRDIGTQFELRVVDADSAAAAALAVRLRVREGRVAVERATGTVEAAAGEELAVAADGTVRRGAVPAYGPEWDWVVAAAPAFAVDGARLGDFLAWAAREGGWRLELADEPGRERAASVVLHGSIEGLALDDALTVMLASCGLGHRIEDGVLVVSSSR